MVSSHSFRLALKGIASKLVLIQSVGLLIVLLPHDSESQTDGRHDQWS